MKILIVGAGGLAAALFEIELYETSAEIKALSLHKSAAFISCKLKP